MNALHQVVITRTQTGGFKVAEMGLNDAGQGETLRTHDIQPEISAEMAAKYLAEVLRGLVVVGDGK